MANDKRFALGKPDGLHSSTWRFWTEKNEIYIAVRDIARDVKTSLHHSGECQTSFTYSFFIRMRELFELTPKQPRHIRKWQAKEIADGLWQLLDIVIPHNNLKQVRLDNKAILEIDWIEPLSDFKNTQFTVFKCDKYLGDNSWVGKNTMNSLLYHTCNLKDGKYVYITYCGQNEYLNKTTIGIPEEYQQCEYGGIRIDISPDTGIGYLVDSFKV